MATSTSKRKEFSFFEQFEKFISESKRGRRLQPNGKRVSEGTIRNYEGTLRLLRLFVMETGFVLRVVPVYRLTKRGLGVERNYWKRFYLKFTDFLYSKMHFFDNYVGLNIKNIRVFFNYLNKETDLQVGSFYKQFYVRKERIAIFPLQLEELKFFINDKEFEAGLGKRMKEVKDIFVFGCTVGLRVSDLLGLRQTNIRLVNRNYYLAVRSGKTSTDTILKLPDYCVAIINKYKKRNSTGRLLPKFNVVNLNLYIKKLLEAGGFVQEVRITRERRGKAVEVANRTRLCDVVSTHTMRRTAITTMLCLGMPEHVVRQISGHAAGSKEFFRYVDWAQVYLDREADKVWTFLSIGEEDAVGMKG